MIPLQVPFAEKDEAKALGARWDPMQKIWYIPDALETQADQFQRWLPGGSVTQPGAVTDSPLAEQAIPANDQEKGVPLSQLMFQVQTALRQRFQGGIWVRAEIANLNERRGHIYLELSETAETGQPIATCRAMIWQSQATHLLAQFESVTGVSLQTGQSVLLLTEVNFHEKFGFSLMVQDIDPSFTLGEIEANLNKIREQLKQEGLLAHNKRFAMPTDFMRLAVVAPPNAAGLGDFRADADHLHQLGLCEFLYFYASFQGDKAETELGLAFENVWALHEEKPFDAMIIIRGGGAKLDLNPLNTYTLAKQVAQASLPVLTGIGHERDNTILDEVAAVRFDTPSKVIAAVRHQIVTGAQTARQHWEQVQHLSRRFLDRQKQQLQSAEHTIQHQSLVWLHRHQSKLTPWMQTIQQQAQAKVQHESYQLSQHQQQVQTQTQHRLTMHRQHLSQMHSIIQTVPHTLLERARKHNKQMIGYVLSAGPKTQLSRGFALVRNSKGEPITEAEQARHQAQLAIQFRDGTVKAVPLDDPDQ
ncbi:exodeoxyribonuclease VII large subunit [Thiomicrospira sp. WB1]|uniref:exodeoxyribonuclease VII large subunit n=1 Tax=Thiomicrospira sp. WB1 TaxID=1685380 RepID=UPI000747A044|nr:exodeoxyribonuclease VII large subunit [Thiomicrospira sp. WB1]KUJ72032.1 exodeoxyribonuclease VII large subunit [Thiomicrospira sp. WB1]